MVTKIHFNNTWRNFNPRKAPSSFRELRAFLIWNEGRAFCRNLNTGHFCEMFLHPLGSFQKKDYKITGFTQNDKGEKDYQIKGSWN